MLEFRISKYDPQFRDPNDRYRRNEWTSFIDVGRWFDGIVVTREEYQRVEDNYVALAMHFLQESRVDELVVQGLENHREAKIGWLEGSIVGLDDLPPLLRRVLREEFWCRLEGPEAFVHFGWDYYLYLGVPRPCPDAEGEARRFGLFVEPIASPYHQRE